MMPIIYSPLVVFICSPAAYELLKGFNILQLPSLQAYTGAFLDNPGMKVLRDYRQCVMTILHLLL